MDIWVMDMQIMKSKRVSEVQRLRVLADLLELIGAIEEDDMLKKEDITEEILRIITDNFLDETPKIYRKN